MINIAKIKKIEESKRQIKKEIYKKIFEQFSRKIQVSVDASQKQTIVQVPSFLLGYPSYDVEKAGVYLKRQLELSGFQVTPISPIIFTVSWYTQKEKTQNYPRASKQRTVQGSAQEQRAKGKVQSARAGSHQPASKNSGG
jgi:hypothetical protein